MARPERKHRTGASAARGSGLSAEPEQAEIEQVEPADEHEGLWSRLRPAVGTVKGGILTAGAVAGAIAAVIALVPRNEPVQFRFTSLTVSPKPVPASEFQPVTTGPVALPGDADGDRVDVRLLAATGLTSSPEQASSSSSPEPTGQTTSPTPTGRPATLSPSLPASPPSAVPGRLGMGLPHAYARKVLAQVRDDYALGACGGPRGACQTLMWGGTHDSEGNLVPPKVAAMRVLKVLSHVRSRPVREGTGGAGGHSGARKDPLGVVVRVNVELEHAEGHPVQVYWEIVDASDGEAHSLSSKWLRGIPAYELRATSDPDSAFFKLWVPLPRRRGDYLISLSARTDGHRLPLVEKTTETPVH